MIKYLLTRMSNLNSAFIFTSLFIFFFNINVFGQEIASPPTSQQPNSSIAIGLNIGTKSLVGVDVAFQPAPNWILKVGYNYLDWKLRNFETNLGFLSEYLSVDGDVRFSNFEILVEHRIFNKKLGLVAGVGYFPVNHYKGNVLLRDSLEYNNTLWTPGELGSVGGSFSYRSPFSPYAGISFGHAIPKKQWGFSFNIGAYYKGRPDIEIIGTNLLDNIHRNEEALENGISSYRWMPMLSFRLAYKLHKQKPPTDTVNAILGKG